MSRMKMEQTFESLGNEGKKAFIAYIMAGDGGLENLKHQMLSLEAAGASVIELGIPFSDPVADGPVIQAAGQRALAEGVTLRGILEELARIKDDISIPVVLMTYANPVLRLGADTFAEMSDEAGVSGVIMPDVPLEESGEFEVPLRRYDITMIRFITLSSSEERIKEVMEGAEGFIYAVTVRGTTGARAGFDASLYDHLESISKMTDVPVCAGFGIGSREQAEAVGSHCDGVIVGSRIVELMHENNIEEIEALIPENADIAINASN
ncbi:tryptophan synthase subunit alpha [Salinicoccus sp. ID82-1]|uniref:Tryptophan synthase alpha chain n=1 Tax=Salinicoccus cyprini TaxID=2493691 RepID=A0A558AWX4_9STAP|nr:MULTISPECIES: tryptophan synthase subunit alpha [Salinicoccus]MCG1010070.1 tryptophan synthase subunit alpha [Salinicoccus sp. ID82-1]TVT28766.1 tryptophan synthase subunit alpha [Salinicoccus cyprini]